MPYKDPGKKRECSRRYREKHREQVLERHRRYYEENREKQRESHRRYHEENRKQILERSRRYHQEHLESARRYREKNRERIRERMCHYQRKRHQEDARYRTIRILRDVVRRALNGNKSLSSLFYLGFESWDELWEWRLSQRSGRGTGQYWHHLLPVMSRWDDGESVFDPLDEIHARLMCHHINLHSMSDEAHKAHHAIRHEDLPEDWDMIVASILDEIGYYDVEIKVTA